MRSSTVKCRRPAGPLTRRQSQAAHATEMAERRLRQRTRTPGFTAVSNARVSGAIQMAFATLMVECADKIATGAVSVAGLKEEAVRQVARTLPRPPMVFDWRNGLPTKNNNPEYRR